MKKQSFLSVLMDYTNLKVYDLEFKQTARKKPQYFTREGKIGFVNLITFTLNFVRKSLQIESDDYFKLIKDKDFSVTKQAYSEARQKCVKGTGV